MAVALLLCGWSTIGEAAPAGELVEVYPCAVPRSTTDSPISGDEALKGCSALIQSKRYAGKELASLLLQRGDVYLEMGNAKAAIADFTRAIALDPDFVDAYRRRGDARLLAHDMRGAIDDYTKAIALAPKDVTLICTRAAAHHQGGDYDRAIADYSAAIALEPNNVQFRTQRALAYESKGDFEHALADYTEAARFDEVAILRVCPITLQIRTPKEAIDACTKAITAVPQSTSSWEMRGLANLKLGRLKEALADFDAALKIDPHSPIALYGRGVAKLKSGDTPGGDADIAAAKSYNTRVAENVALYGVTP